MQCKKLGFYRLFKGFGSHKVPYSLIVNCFGMPIFDSLNSYSANQKTKKQLTTEKSGLKYATIVEQCRPLIPD